MTMPFDPHPASLGQKARLLWPRLDRRAISRCNDDAWCIARQVTHRSHLPIPTIVRMLTDEGESGTVEEVSR
jgi:hypothetical protein